MKAQMREAGRCKTEIAIIIGDEELNNNKVIVKDMSTGKQQDIAISEVTHYFSNIPTP